MIRRLVLYVLLGGAVAGLVLAGAFFFVVVGPSTQTTVVEVPAEPVRLPETPLRRLHLARSEPLVKVGVFSSSDGSLLLRELTRQAVLIAGREELGLVVRDETLHDEITASDPHRLDLQHEATYDQVDFSLSLGPGTHARWTHSWRIPVEPTPSGIPNYPAILARLEELSRTEIPPRLTEARFERALPEEVAGPQPSRTLEELEQGVARLGVGSQLEVVRHWHSLPKQQRDDPRAQMLAVRAYANLAMLTHSFWLSSSPAFAARAILYAQRMVARQPDSPIGYWARAYAFALIGLDGLALEDLARAKERQQSDEESPPWGRVLEAQCQYDADGVRSAARAAQLDDDLVRFLEFRSIGGECYPSRRAQQLAVEFLKARHAECVPITSYVMVGFSLPDARQTMVQADQSLHRSFAALVQGETREPAGVAPDRLDRQTLLKQTPLWVHRPANTKDLEPTLATVGRVFQDWALHQWIERVHFMSSIWNVPLGPPVLAEILALQDHPMADLARLAFWESENPALLAELRQRTWVDLRVTAFAGTKKIEDQGVDSLNPGKCWSQMLLHQDATGMDFAAFYHSLLLTTSMTPRWLAISPHRPVAQALSFSPEMDAGAIDQAALIRRIGSHPESTLSIAKKLIAVGRLNEAIEALKGAVRKDGSEKQYFMLAEAYQKQGDLDSWRATLDEFIQQPEQELGHAQARVEIAYHLMGKREFQEAWPYAERAAGTFAAWGLFCGASCADALGNLAVAEEMLQAAADRYPDQVLKWYLFCVRTGVGDAKAARQQLDDFIRAQTDGGESFLPFRQGARATVDGDEREAASFWAQAFEGADPTSINRVFYGLLAGTSYLLANRPEEADSFFQKARPSSGEQPDPPRDMDQLAALLVEVRSGARKTITQGDLAPILKTASPADQSDLLCIAGRFLLGQGDREGARAFLTQVEPLAFWHHWCGTFAKVHLRQMGEEDARNATQ
jgi:tetratricopeptide (TPR) repeat protein